MERDQAIALLHWGSLGVFAWNRWREKHTITEVPDLSGGLVLIGAHLKGVHLSDVNLEEAILADANLDNAVLSRANLKNAILCGARLNGASLIQANLKKATLSRAQLAGAELYKANMKHADCCASNFEGANLFRANLKKAMLCDANLKGADLSEAHLEEAKLDGLRIVGGGVLPWEYPDLEAHVIPGAHLERANLNEAHLEGANLRGAHLEEANLSQAHLEGADLTASRLQGTTVRMATTDGATLLAGLQTDMRTDFTGVGLGNVRVEPHIRSKLEYNIRRIGWQRRYKESWCVRLFPGIILWLCDYGRGSRRIIISFSFFAVLFASIYLIPTGVPAVLPESFREYWITFDCEPFLKNLDDEISPHEPHGSYVRCIRALYFSIVTMTTLGFGDVSAHPDSFLGHILVMLQVIIGYVLLGALVTRLAILFQSVE